jgi:hypothetical protein
LLESKVLRETPNACGNVWDMYRYFPDWNWFEVVVRVAPYMSSDMTTVIRINLEQHDECLKGRNCLQIPEPLFHSLSIGSSSCSHVLMYWLYFLNIVVRFLFLGVIGYWVLVAHSVFLIFYHAFKIQSEMTKRCKEVECWTFSGKSTHSSWKIRLLLIIFGTYIQLNRVYMCPFVWFFKYFWATDTSDYSLTLRTIDLSDQWTFGSMNLRTNALEPNRYRWWLLISYL